MTRHRSSATRVVASVLGALTGLIGLLVGLASDIERPSVGPVDRR